MRSFYLTSVLCILGMTLMLLPGSLSAQQDAQYTEYMFNSLAYNPAYAGSREAISANAIYRNQWWDFEGAPKTVSFSIHAPFRDKYGWGVSAVHDRIGVHEYSGAMASFSYHFYVSKTAKLSVAVQGGALYHQSDFASINTQGNDPNFTTEGNEILPNFGVGLYFYSKAFYLGLSAPHLLDNQLTEVSKLARQYRHYYAAAGYVFPISENLKLKPSVLLKMVPASAPLEADVNLNLFIQDFVWVGATYRTGASSNLLLGAQLTRNVSLAYSYDFVLTDIQDHTNGSHEVMLGFDWSLSNQRIVSPRYF